MRNGTGFRALGGCSCQESPIVRCKLKRHSVSTASLLQKNFNVNVPWNDHVMDKKWKTIGCRRLRDTLKDKYLYLQRLKGNSRFFSVCSNNWVAEVATCNSYNKHINSEQIVCKCRCTTTHSQPKGTFYACYAWSGCKGGVGAELCLHVDLTPSKGYRLRVLVFWFLLPCTQVLASLVYLETTVQSFPKFFFFNWP